ncbi:hypothetical protein MNBD_GAMMA23-1038 [hydrothermal vent metagenome]|uniref:NlpC/P60 domain-containing protein n=1 Tax=hydrothermal vent metagenome TaxID=652676 RepID=A0A3B0ZVT4_9ZZZZ
MIEVRLYLALRMKIAQILYKNSRYLLLSIALSVLLTGCSSTSQKTYHAKPHSQHKKILKIAKTQLGKPYRYGGRSPKTGFDCSGLVQYSYKMAGISVPRTTRQLYNAARPIRRQHLKAGDLVFFRIDRGKISHVGLYIGNNKFIHAPSSGKRVNIANMNNRYWRKHFSRGGRL